MKLRMLPPALEDLEEAGQFYENSQKELGQRFMTELIGEIDSLRYRAGIHRVCLGYHRLLVHRFPFAVFYKIISEEVIVFRVLDCRCDPKWIQAKLGDPEDRP